MSEEQTEIQTEIPEAMPDNMRIWDKYKETDRKFVKKVQYGRKFDTIAAYFQFQQATELWGPQGIGWDVTDPEFVINNEVAGESILIGTLSLWYMDGGQKITMSAETSAVYITDKSNKADVDAWKKLKTELTTKSLSRLGFAADIYTGQLDVDNKYGDGTSSASWDKEREGVQDTSELVRKDYAELAKEMGFDADRDGVFRRKFAKMYPKESITQTSVKKLRLVVESIRGGMTPPKEDSK